VKGRYIHKVCFMGGERKISSNGFRKWLFSALWRWNNSNALTAEMFSQHNFLCPTVTWQNNYHHEALLCIFQIIPIHNQTWDTMSLDMLIYSNTIYHYNEHARYCYRGHFKIVWFIYYTLF